MATPIPEPLPAPRFVGAATSSGIPLPLPAEPSEPVAAPSSEPVVIPRPVYTDRSSGRRAIPHPVLSELSSSLSDAASRHGTGRVVLPPHVRMADGGTGRTPSSFAVGTGPMASALSLPAINRELDQLGLSAIPRPVLADTSRYAVETCRVAPPAPQPPKHRLVWATLAGLGAGVAAFLLASMIGMV